MFIRNGEALGSVLKSALPGAEPTPKKRGRPAKAESTAPEQKADAQDTPPPAKPIASASATAAETKPPTASSGTEEKK